MPTSLSDYVEQHTQAPRCAVCDLPKEVLTQVNRGVSVGKDLMSRWLREEQGHSVGATTLRRHFQFKHHESNEVS